MNTFTIVCSLLLRQQGRVIRVEQSVHFVLQSLLLSLSDRVVQLGDNVFVKLFYKNIIVCFKYRKLNTNIENAIAIFANTSVSINASVSF